MSIHRRSATERSTASRTSDTCQPARKVAVRATVPGEGVEPFVNLDRLELMDPEGNAGDRPEGSVVPWEGPSSISR